MSSLATRKPVSTAASEPTDWGGEILLSPWLWGPVLTVGFYQVLPWFPEHAAFLQRYFCSHWTLYAEMAAFFLGMAILARKAISLLSESRSLSLDVLQATQGAGALPPAARAEALRQSLARVPAGLRTSKLVQRVREVCDYVTSRSSSQSLENHLRYLADMAADSLSASYSAVRTITWAIPILGFLGTVIGITMAIANITPEQLSSSLTAVTAGLAVAFDTTALALALSMILVFTTYLIERGESRILSRIEQFGIAELAPALAGEGPEETPLAAAQSQAAELLLKRSEEVISWQTELWQTALENLRARWLETAEAQQVQFSDALRQGMSATLADHTQQLADARADFLTGFQGVGRQLARVADGLQSSALAQQEALHRQASEVWEQIRLQMEAAREQHEALIGRTAETLSQTVGAWHEDLLRATDAMSAQLQELQRQGEVLGRLTEQEEALARTQAVLQQNLQAVRGVESFEELIHSLSAAVHLLTGRARSHAA